jgi:hypothetical protein
MAGAFSMANAKSSGRERTGFIASTTPLAGRHAVRTDRYIARWIGLGAPNSFINTAYVEKLSTNGYRII